ncbi:DNA repair and recombination protein pif1, mitochondrial [Termitomyces sp. J132]|nr:DNA repair and recombination protein pif1, mitochondrial [Termitomyces sp. J132]
MLLTPPTTPNRSSSSPRRRYPNSSRLWQDYRQLVDVSVQTSPSHPSRSQITPTRPSHVDYPQAAPQRSNLSPTSPHVLLSEEQKHVIELVKSEKSLFFTGAAGTGKSVLLRKIIKELRDLWGTEAVAVTATTGIAGVNIGGSTVHSFAGIGLGKEKAEVLAEVIIKSSRLKDRWNKTRVLVIDEISMMDGQLFDKLEYVARVVRGNNKPFGGIQLVLSGDFFQLPPVPEQSHNYRMTSTCAFDARTWSQCILQTVHLTNVFRQKDNTFVELLSSMRVGNLTRKHIDILRCLSRPVVYNDGIESSEIFPLRKEVESCNNARLNALPGPQFEYKSVDRIGFDYLGAPIPREMAEVLLDKLVAVPKITLKVSSAFCLVFSYVAVSRATTLEHLQIINFDPAKISAHPRVIQWHNDMERLTVQEKMEVSSSISFNLEMMDSEEAMHRYWRDVDGYREDWTDSGDVSACTERYTWRTD